MKHLSYLLVVCFGALLAACGSSDGGFSPSMPTVAPPIAASPSRHFVPAEVVIGRRQVFPAASCSKAMCIYVTNGNGSNSVTVYAANANGNVPPMRTISGSRTRLNGPVGIALDAGGNIYVANAGSSVVTVYGPGSNGNVAPIRTIAGSKTGLSEPNGIALDRRGTVFVANASGGTSLYNGSVTVYAPDAHGDVSPIRMISGSNTGLEEPDGIARDSTGNLYVDDLLCGQRVCNGDLLIYASDATGNVAPTRSFDFGVWSSGGIALNANGDVFLTELYPFGAKSQVAVYGSGTSKRIRHIRGSSTQLYGPTGIAVAKNGSVYVANHFHSVSVTVYAPNAHGNVAPIRTISGSSTGLNDPRGIAIH